MITVPNQAIFVVEGTTWVYVADGGGFDRRSVELGLRSVSRTVITEGLEEGEAIALVNPEDDSEAG